MFLFFFVQMAGKSARAGRVSVPQCGARSRVGNRTGTVTGPLLWTQTPVAQTSHREWRHEGTVKIKEHTDILYYAKLRWNMKLTSTRGSGWVRGVGLGYWVNVFTASGSGKPGGTTQNDIGLGTSYFMPAVLLSVFIFLCLSSSSIPFCHLSFLKFIWTSIWENTFAWVDIFYWPTEWNLPSLLSWEWLCFSWGVLSN